MGTVSTLSGEEYPDNYIPEWEGTFHAVYEASVLLHNMVVKDPSILVLLADSVPDICNTIKRLEAIANGAVKYGFKEAM